MTDTLSQRTQVWQIAAACARLSAVVPPDGPLMARIAEEPELVAMLDSSNEALEKTLALGDAYRALFAEALNHWERAWLFAAWAARVLAGEDGR